MGSPVRPIVANFHMEAFEHIAITTAKYPLRIIIIIINLFI